MMVHLDRNQTKSVPHLIQSFFQDYIIGQRQLSKETVSSYRDAFSLYLQFLQSKYGVSPDKITMEHFSYRHAMDFNDHLCNARHCSARTANQRFSAIRSFLHYAGIEAPEYLGIINKTLSLHLAKSERKEMCFLTRKEYEEMQRACGSSIEYCHRDRLILALLYNTGCRVSELVGLRICDFSGIQTKDTASVLFHGKGRKDRRTPIWESTAKLVRQYMQKESLSNGDFLFRSRNGSPLTRSGVAQRIGLLASLASRNIESLSSKRVTPHTFRHTCAMNMIQSGVGIETVAMILGHESIETTHKYVVSDIEMKKAAMEKIAGQDLAKMPRYKASKGLLDFLKSL